MLNRGGMALGVIPGTRIEERIVQLEPDDVLVFSTDGVTEAFSPRGELFGLDRLRATVQDAPSSAAELALQHVERAVAQHMDIAPASDDLTLLVLRRRM
jgi:sigma-B regulation protein RsbU (phosphoserine phosphatase)